MNDEHTKKLAKDIDSLFHCADILSQHLHQVELDILEIQQALRELADRNSVPLSDL